MSDALSPNVEQVINDALSLGVFPSRKALLETAVLELRAAQGDLAARLELCEQAIDDIEAGNGAEWDPEEVKQRLRKLATGDSTREAS
jgi:Arc/MetJ-type ribon-helix-helix transcriptional regulator